MSIKKNLLLMIFGSIIFVILIDLTISIFIVGFDYEPSENKLKNYFSYGYSTSSKLDAAMGKNDNEAKPIAFAGWYDSYPLEHIENKKTCGKTISIYGMSFSNRIADELVKINPCLTIVKFAGPGAPLSHSISTFDQYKNKEQSDVIIIGILASALPKINTVAHFNSAFEYPSSSLYPRYYLKEDKLISSGMPYKSLADVRNALSSSNTRDAFIEFVAKNDAYYNDFVFAHSWADKFNTLKMLRRAYAQTYKRNQAAKYFNNGAFTNTDSMIDVSQALVIKMVEDVRNINKTPIIILFNDRGHTDALTPIFSQLLDDLEVKFINSTDHIDNNNLDNFEDDGHFTNKNDIILAQALKKMLADLE